MSPRFLKKLRFSWTFHMYAPGRESWEILWQGVVVGMVIRYYRYRPYIAYLCLPLGADSARGEKYHESVIAERWTPGPAKQALRRAARAVIGQLSKLPTRRAKQEADRFAAWMLESKKPSLSVSPEERQ
jgi:hypothetical protein